MRKRAADLTPGDVIAWDPYNAYALVVSQTIPADTVPARSKGYTGPDPAESYCEPGLVILRHFKEDMWVQSHEFTYMLRKLDEKIETYSEIRVQAQRHLGPYMSGQELIDYFSVSSSS